jgi:hypothetical protein
MLIYQNTKGGFVDDVRNCYIAKKITEAFLEHNLSHNTVMTVIIH